MDKHNDGKFDNISCMCAFIHAFNESQTCTEHRQINSLTIVLMLWTVWEFAMRHTNKRTNESTLPSRTLTFGKLVHYDRELNPQTVDRNPRAHPEQSDEPVGYRGIAPQTAPHAHAWVGHD